MTPPWLLAALPQSSSFYAILLGIGFLVAIYARAARFPRLQGIAIVFIFVVTILTLIVARGTTPAPDVKLP